MTFIVHTPSKPDDRKVLYERYYKAGYIVRTELVFGKPYGCDDFQIESAYTHDELYLGNPEEARFLCEKMGIRPELRTPTSKVCSIGFCEKEQKWYGWSHRAMGYFGIGSVVKEGDCYAKSDWEPDEDENLLPVGFEAKTLDDARLMACAFAESVS